jgi:hypothetical protein
MKKEKKFLKSRELFQVHFKSQHYPDVKNYRGISLENRVIKVLNKIVN